MKHDRNSLQNTNLKHVKHTNVSTSPSANIHYNSAHDMCKNVFVINNENNVPSYSLLKGGSKAMKHFPSVLHSAVSYYRSSNNKINRFIHPVTEDCTARQSHDQKKEDVPVS